MATSDEVIFAWAIGKALLIVVVSFGIVLYIAWAGTTRMLRSRGKTSTRASGTTAACAKSQ